MERKLKVKTLVLICMVFLIPLLVPAVAAWAANGTPLYVYPEPQMYPQLCSDGSLGAIVVWQDRRSGLSNDLYAQRIDRTGKILWTADGILICNAEDVGNEQGPPQIVSDGADGAIMTWTCLLYTSPSPRDRS